MNDLDTRARGAASGLRDAVEQFGLNEMREARTPPRRRVSFALGGVALTLVVVVIGVVLAERTTEHPPASAITHTQVRGYAYSMAVDPSGVFVANQTTELLRLDRRRGEITARIPTERATYQVVAARAHGVWGWGGGDGGDASGDLVAFGRSTVRPRRTVHLADGVSSAAFAAGRLWVLDHTGDLSARDPNTLEISFETQVPGATNGGSLSTADGQLWIATSKVLYRYETDPSRVSGPRAVVQSGTSSFRSIATDGRWLWSSACSDDLGQHCFLERRNPRTGALINRLRADPIAGDRYGGPTGAAGGIVGADGAVWAIAAQGRSLLRTTPRGGVDDVLTIPRRLRSDGSADQYRYFTVGAGALWYSVPEAGRIYRIPLP